MKSILAINDMVIVEEMINVNEKKTGIIIPGTVKMEPQKYGKVLSVGELVKNIKVNDVIIFHQAGGQAMFFEGVVQRVLKNNEIYGILKSES